MCARGQSTCVPGEGTVYSCVCIAPTHSTGCHLPLNTRYVLSESVVPILQAFCYSDSDSPYPQCNQDGGIAHDNTVYGLVMRALWAIAGGTHSQYVVSDDIELVQQKMPWPALVDRDRRLALAPRRVVCTVTRFITFSLSESNCDRTCARTHHHYHYNC
jgi:hypothetical protein